MSAPATAATSVLFVPKLLSAAPVPRSLKTCCEETGRQLSDKATRLFVNAAAWAGCTDAHLRALLRYFCEGTIGDDPFVHDVDAAMVEVRSLPEWREARMTFEQYLIQERERVREETERRVREEDAALYVALSAAGRMEEFPQALADEGVHAALLDEFGISVGAQ